jgi:hypothetical protein
MPVRILIPGVKGRPSATIDQTASCHKGGNGDRVAKALVLVARCFSEMKKDHFRRMFTAWLLIFGVLAFQREAITVAVTAHQH